MNIYLRDKNGELAVKDILAVNFDMSVIQDKKSGKYRVRVNNEYDEEAPIFLAFFAETGPFFTRQEQTFVLS